MIKIEIVGIECSKEICTFLDKNSPYKRDLHFWTWMHKLWSSEDSITVVGKKNGQIIAHYSVIIQPFIFGNKKINIGLGLHALVQSEFRRDVSISDISIIAYREAKRRGLSFLYGFPNKNYRIIQERLERWTKVEIFDAYERINSNVQTTSNTGFELHAVREFNLKSTHRLSVLLKNQCNTYARILKDIKYYENRYLKHPEHPYKCFIIEREKKIEGFVVFKSYYNKDKEEKHGHLVDFIISENISKKDLINAFLMFFRDDVDRYVLWRVDKNFEKILIEEGFKATSFDTFFGIKFLDKAFEFKAELSQFDNWQLFMGDSDAF